MTETTQPIITESPISANVKGYYKGYPIQITNRDPNMEVKPLLMKAMQIVEFMTAHDFKPSWNDDTNKKVNAPEHQKDGLTSMCATHGVPMQEAFSKKTNKPYWFHKSQEGAMCFGKGFLDKS